MIALSLDPNCMRGRLVENATIPQKFLAWMEVLTTNAALSEKLPEMIKHDSLTSFSAISRFGDEPDLLTNALLECIVQAWQISKVSIFVLCNP